MASRLVRAEREDDGDLLFIVAGERGAVEMRVGPSYSTFRVHSPASLVISRGRKSVITLPCSRPCYTLEGECWTALVGCGSYDFDRPDVDEVPQWEALEELYLAHLGGGRG